jgi:two-component system LytT family response regulator
MKRTTIILAESNALALEMLTNDISKYHKKIEVIGTATSVVEAAKLLRQKKPIFYFGYHA